MSLRTDVHSGLLIRDVILTSRSLANGRRLQIRTGTGSRPVLTPINVIVDDDAGMLPPPRLRTLDAIHLAAAQRADRSLRAVFTHDARTADAAADSRLPTRVASSRDWRRW